MANAGLSVYTADKHLILDENYQNLRLSRKIKLTGAGTTTGTFEDGEILAAIGGLDASVNIDAYCENGSTGYTAIVNTYVEGLYIYIFSDKYEKRNSGVGLQVFNANGEVVYDSNNKTPIIIASLHNKDADLPKDKRIAVMCGSPRKEIMTSVSNSQTTTQGSKAEQTWVPETSHMETVDNPTFENVTVKEGHFEWQTHQEWDPIENRYVTKGETVWVPPVTEMQWVHHYSQKKVVDTPGHYETKWVPTNVTTYYVTSAVTETRKNYAVTDGKIKLKTYSTNLLANKTEYAGEEEHSWFDYSDSSYFYHKTHPYAYNTTSDVSTFLAIDVTNL